MKCLYILLVLTLLAVSIGAWLDNNKKDALLAEQRRELDIAGQQIADQNELIRKEQSLNWSLWQMLIKEKVADLPVNTPDKRSY